MIWTDSKSEIAQLRRRIEMELEAMRQGLYGYAAGSARHEFIRARMENVGAYQEMLAEQIGEDEATQVLCHLYVSIIDA
ncbi:MAG: hypothetical protein H0W02_02520 [Ktedonobacteraceae bacterium]|nr:hypothetical protein [Ktedonobacteraceae bacterium]